ncbi:uncharacterized protein LOC119723516 [Patiria miniata]|uniref:CxC2-like cysteine cluster KDZ transposase-associated domain-containing protein n=1 Tax=Patiria miniata TaxID=46514 RepID=A0A913ZFB8_PATMI|nr:uncharacterized protein LOC119723516 [Patiria miniata]
MPKVWHPKFKAYTINSRTRRACGEEKVLTHNLSEDGPGDQYTVPLREAREQMEVSQADIRDDIPSCSTHQAMKEANLSSWQLCRQHIEDAYMESLVSQTEYCCSCNVHCEEQYLCKDCSPHIVRCTECTRAVHQNNSLLHKPEKYVDGELQPVQLIILYRRQNHTCISSYTKQMQVYDALGRIHESQFAFCRCEAEAVTLVRHHFWPSTPHSPRSAIHLDLMDLLVFLLLEARTSLHASCQTLRWKNGLTAEECSTLYRVLHNETFEEYRHFKYQVSSLQVVSPSLDDGTACPACPTVNGSLFLCLDGNFGLVRKSNSGFSTNPPKHKTRMFADSKDVDEFVGNQTEDKDPEQDCSMFQAGDILRSKNKARGLTSTGVFGCSCRHGMPKLFLDMRHGERMAYSVFVVNLLRAELNPGLKLHIIYDIACKLDRHLERHYPTDRYSDVILGLPVFHSYGHKMNCQVQYSTRWKQGFGLTDGETMERLWSYLRRFSAITKEMTPSHRVDLLTDGLLHFARRKRDSLGHSLVSSMEKAYNTVEKSQLELDTLLAEWGVSHAAVKEAQAADRLHAEQKPSNKKQKTGWREEYVHLLMNYDQHLDQVQLCSDPKRTRVLITQSEQLSAKLLSTEAKYHIPNRWTSDSKDYRVARTSLERRKQQDLLQRLWRESVEYRFCLNTKNKYSEGQAIAQRISKQISRASKAIKRTVTVYNNEKFTLVGPRSIILKDAFDPSGHLYAEMDMVSKHTDQTRLPDAIRRKAVDLQNLLDRASEEKSILTQEMKNVLEFTRSQLRGYQQASATCLREGQLGKGVLLRAKINDLARNLENYKALFEPSFHDTMPSAYLYDWDDMSDDDDSDEDDSDVEDIINV